MKSKSLLELYNEQINDSGSLNFNRSLKKSLADMYNESGGVQVKEKYSEEVRKKYEENT